MAQEQWVLCFKKQQKMKILLVGENFRGMLLESIYRNLLRLGVETETVNTHDLFKTSFANRVLNKFLKTPHYFGLGVKKINQIVLERVLTGRFDFIFFIKPVLIYPETIAEIKKTAGGRTKTIGLTSDAVNIFNYHSDYFYRSMPFFDLYIAGRREDGEAMYKFGAKKVYCFLIGADPSCHYPVKVSADEKEKLGADVVFLGSYVRGEHRIEYMEKLCRDGYNVKIYGNNWEKLPADSCLCRKNRIIPGSTRCEAMSKVIAASKIVLAFMRETMDAKISLRTFEIPLCRGFMLHQRTKEAERLLIPDKEAVFFGDYKEMKEKIDFYLEHPELRNKIAEAGYKKILNCGLLSSDMVKKLVSILKNEISEADVLVAKH